MCTQIWEYFRACDHMVFRRWVPCDNNRLDHCPDGTIQRVDFPGKCEECAYPTPPET
ncbi:hypothetical protein F5X99DRAFT_368578 [Biscogniauxia marginata]|nr:hypothetical protein F5X99DRAFT_368578 [Biscogniauxia marginata]